MWVVLIRIINEWFLGVYNVVDFFFDLNGIDLVLMGSDIVVEFVFLLKFWYVFFIDVFKSLFECLLFL